jgi:hypothetical protein
LCIVCRDRRVLPGCGEFSRDVIFDIFDKVYLIYQSPKLDELDKMVCCGDLVGVKLPDPKMLVQPFLHREILSFGDGEDGWL